MSVPAHKSAEWSRLDNAAKIFPSTSNRRDTKVFRFVCELTEPVNGELLQRAALRTLEAFPLYRSILRKGVFWYFFEDSGLLPKVSEEHCSPCRELYNENQRGLLFEVTYFRCRVNLEVYHALSDGTGALEFLRTLVCHYLALRHPERFPRPPLPGYDASRTEKMDDSFSRYYGKKTDARVPRPQRAYRLSGERESDERLRIIEGVASVRAVIDKAHEYGATLTGLLAAALLCAIHGEMPVRKEKLPVALAVPVNLRNYFPSSSARNFFGVVNVAHSFKKGGAELPEVIASVTGTLKNELTAERLAARMNELSAMEHNLLARAVPLVLKDVVLKIANWVSQRTETAALSNIGRITMPEETREFIRLFDVFTGTPRIQLCICSFEDRLTMAFTLPFRSTDVPKRFFRTLTGMGLGVEVAANALLDETEG